MIKFQVFDSPIGNPDNDLFGMANYAQKLANFIDCVEPPFTIGVYGQWGDGKTSFVRLVDHYLTKSAKKSETKFITFSAWPHTTSDAIWRALIIHIAKELFGVKDENKNQIEVPETTTRPGERFIELLKKDAWTLWSPPPPPQPNAGYYELISRLDKTAYGAISKNKAEQQQFSEEATLMAIVKTGITALGSLSPIVAGFRALFGFKDNVDVDEDLNQGKSISARKLIESVDEFKSVLNELFEKTAKNKRVFVFIDDLDRCLPDAALDLLEATKIFFDNVRCIFIVAADENLIGQGLRLRFKDLLETRNETRIEQLIAQKGKEYFEKIIQFPIRVPARTAVQAHRFISAQFPQWTPATDIIQTALGINPRRLIQYCNLLSYKYDVYRMQARLTQSEKDPKPDGSAPFEYLDKLIALHAWFPECLPTFNRLLFDPNIYSEQTKGLEDWLNRSPEDTPLADAEKELKITGCDELYRRAVALTPIYNLMRSAPLFSAADPALLSTFLRMADIQPSTGDLVLSVRDSVFSRILSVVQEQGRLTARKLLIDDVTKLITFDRSYPSLAGLLFKIAKHPNWMDELRFIEENLQNPDVTTTGVTLSKNGVQLLESLKSIATGDPKLTPVFLSTPRFSSITPQEISLYENVRSQLKGAKDELNKNFQSATGPDRYSRTAVNAVDLFPQAERDAIEATLQLQVDAAMYFLELRRFTKLDALAFRWPDLGDSLRADINGFIRTYETPANEAGTPENEEVSLLFRQDSRLREFLRLRPLFSGIADRELNQYFAVAEVVVKASDIETRPPAPPPSTEPSPAAPAPVLPSQAVAPVAYENLNLQMRQFKPDKYRLVLNSSVGDLEVNIDLVAGEIAQLNATIQNLFLYRSGTREVLSNQISFSQDPTNRLIELGSYVYSKLFKIGGAEEALLKSIEHARLNKRRLRILLHLEDDLPGLIPWEALYIPSLGLFPALTSQGFSMVRLLPEARPLTSRTMHSPLRILLAISTPRDAPYLEVGREKAMLEESLDAAIKNNLVRLEVIEHATKQKLLRAFTTFRPNIFHFMGHGILQQEPLTAGKGALVLENEDGATDLLGGEMLRTIMGQDSSVSLAILNSCETGATTAGDAISGVAQNLVATGTPAVIATMRVILDQTALMFTREFYRSFVDGFPLEPSIVEARKNLAIHQADWPAYVLFAGTNQLDDFKLVPT